MMHGLVIDNFACGGGASEGIEQALGRPVDYAINHDAEALNMHRANHPRTVHLCEDVREIDPRKLVAGRPVELVWFSPDCKHFSKAKGGKPLDRSIRALVWVMVKWARLKPPSRPRVLVMENVEEIASYGPLDANGRPIRERDGEYFRLLVSHLQHFGFTVEFRELRSCDYGAPTIRKRLIMICRSDGAPIAWPEPTHAKDGAHGLAPWRTAAGCIDWSLPCPSIFGRRKDLIDNTLRRIARGVMKFVVRSDKPFIVKLRRHSTAQDVDEPLHTISAGGGRGGGHFGLVNVEIAPHVTKFRTGATGHRLDEPLHTITANSFRKRSGGALPLGLVEATLAPFFVGAGGPAYGGKPTSVDAPFKTILRENHTAVVGAFLAQHNGERGDRVKAGRDVGTPISTVTASARQQQLVAAFLAQHNGGEIGRQAELPLSTLTAGCSQQQPVVCDLSDDDRAGAERVTAFLIKYYGTGEGHSLFDPMHTVTGRDRFGLVCCRGVPIVDIGMRMLSKPELYRAQGFPESYIIDRGADGKPLTQAAQGKMVGNSVPPPLARAVVLANMTMPPADIERFAA